MITDTTAGLVLLCIACTVLGPSRAMDGAGANKFNIIQRGSGEYKDLSINGSSQGSGISSDDAPLYHLIFRGGDPLRGIVHYSQLPMTDPNGAAIYGAPWIPSIYPLYVSIYTSTMDPMISMISLCQNIASTSLPPPVPPTLGAPSCSTTSALAPW